MTKEEFEKTILTQNQSGKQNILHMVINIFKFSPVKCYIFCDIAKYIFINLS